MSERLLSPAQVAERASVSVWTVHQWIALGRHGGLWPTLKLSHKCRRIPESALERFLARRGLVPSS